MKKYSLLIFIFFIVACAGGQSTEVIPLNSQEARQKLNKDKKIVVLDVRTPGEYAAGHVANSINIDVNQADAKEKINKLDKNTIYLVYCRTKNRSGVVTNYMVQNGFTSVYQIVDGIAGLGQENLLVTN